MKMNNTVIDLRVLYDMLYKAYGPQHWWPAESSFEVIIGAILTQSTNWSNVEKALCNVKNKGLFSPEKLHDIQTETLAELIRSSGYYNQKAARIKSFLVYFKSRYDCRIDLMQKEDLCVLRDELLAISGIGEETADSILLYALDKPTFVVDAYTKRILTRLGYIDESFSYAQVKHIFESRLKHDAALYNEYHALIVYHGKHFCKSRPVCASCLVRDSCLHYKSA